MALRLSDIDTVAQRVDNGQNMGRSSALEVKLLPLTDPMLKPEAIRTDIAKMLAHYEMFDGKSPLDVVGHDASVAIAEKEALMELQDTVK